MSLFTEFISGRFVIAGTGSRSYRRTDEVFDRLYQQTSLFAEKYPDLVLMSGGAQGWDTEIANVAWLLNVPFVMCIPNKGYGPYYWKNNLDGWYFMLACAAAIEYTMEDVYQSNSLYLNGVHSNYVRNSRMVELADAFFVYDAGSSGTRDAVKKIEQAGKPYKRMEGRR